MENPKRKSDRMHESSPHCWCPLLRVWPQICPDLMKALPRKEHQVPVSARSVVERLRDVDSRSGRWTDLPQHLLERIFDNLKDETDVWVEQRNFFVASGVCRTWREVAKQAFTSEPWKRAPLICNPSELFSLSPVAAERRLLQCFLKRTELRSELGTLQGYKYTLHYGADYTDPNAKLLLSAVQDSRNKIKISASGDPIGTEPVARLASNMLCTSYNLVASKTSWVRKMLGGSVPAVTGDSDKPLAGIQYKLRMQGIMLPRRMRVTIPYCTSWHALPESGLVPDWPSRSPTIDMRPGHSRENSGDVPVPDLLDASEAPEGSSSGTGGQDFGLQILNRCATKSIGPCSPVSVASPASMDLSVFDKARQKRLEAGLKLKNKQPHWNEGLRCWCLNFRGRVKLASVKNFQLVRAEDSCKRVVMQFGKVDKHTFIMDYNPCVLSAVQAFSLSLTTFGGKFLL